MCHFHSVIVDGAGRIYHRPENSHSGIAYYYKLDNSDLSSPFWECEWDGIGEQPVHLCQNRGRNIEPTALAVAAADRHYAKLASFLKGDNDSSPLFLAPEYADVPAHIEWAKAEIAHSAKVEAEQALAKRLRESAEALGQSIFASVGAAVEALSDEGMILAVRAFVQELSVSLEDVASEEIDAATEDMIRTEDAEEYVCGNGDYAYIGDGDYIYTGDMDQYVGDSDDYFTQDQLDTAIKDAKAEWKREVFSAIENVG